MSNRLDGIKWNPRAHIAKYSPEVVEELTRILGYEPKAVDLERFSADPFATLEVEGNLLTTAGLGNITNLIIGGGGNPFNSAKGIIGVGNSTTTASAADVKLGADNSANAWYQQVDGAPTLVTTTVTNDTIQATGTFASGDANFAWNEWCWATTSTGTITAGIQLSGVSSGTEVMLNHKIATMGTKASGSIWVFTTKITLS